MSVISMALLLHVAPNVRTRCCIALHTAPNAPTAYQPNADCGLRCPAFIIVLCYCGPQSCMRFWVGIGPTSSTGYGVVLICVRSLHLFCSELRSIHWWLLVGGGGSEQCSEESKMVSAIRLGQFVRLQVGHGQMTLFHPFYYLLSK